MISAPSSSSASCRSAFTVACVPTGMKEGVWMAPCGVFKTPRRAPVGSVLLTLNERLTASVYQEKTQAMVTPTRVKKTYTETTTPADFDIFAFFGSM